MKIGLLGHGVVGSGVRQIIDTQLTSDIKKLEIKKILVKDESEITDDRMTLQYEDILNDDEIDVVVECMGGLEPAHTFITDAMKKGKHIVTSNKKMFATYYTEIMDLAKENNVAVMYEATCGGGIAWIDALNRTKKVDNILEISGIFNGTTNYILTKMHESNVAFRDVLKDAQNLGYAEADPSDDIDGLDARYKIAISSYTAFNQHFPIENVICYGIRNLQQQDVEYAKKLNATIKLLATARKNENSLEAYVMPNMISNNQMLAQVSNNFNAITCESNTLGSALYYGQGAGSLPTAHAVVQDILIIENGNPSTNTYEEGIIDNQIHRGKYYVRTKRPIVFKDIIEEEISEDAFLTKEVSLFEIHLACVTASDDSLFIAEVNV